MGGGVLDPKRIDLEGLDPDGLCSEELDALEGFQGGEHSSNRFPAIVAGRTYCIVVVLYFWPHSHSKI